MESKFKVGDKVVPVSKSVNGNLRSSLHWKKAKTTGYLYVTGFAQHNNSIICACYLSDGGGDYFLESDLIHYIQ